MFFEPESWTGLRSPVAIEQNLSDERDTAGGATRSSQLKVWASRIGAIVDWTGTTRERRAHRAGPAAAGEFLHERRVFILDAGKR